MKNLIQAAAFILFVASQAQAQQAVQWRVPDGGNGHWYQGVVFPPATSRTWVGSRDLAKSLGGDLATLTTAAEADWVYVSVVANRALWEGDFGPYVGLYQLDGAMEPGGGWVWVDATANSGSVPWYWNQPDNFAAPCGGDQFAAYWTGGPWFPAPRNHVGDVSGSGHCCCDPGTDRIPSALIEWSADCNNDGIVDYGQCRDGSLPDYNGNNIPDCCEAGTPCVVGSYPIQWRVQDGGNGHWYAISSGYSGWAVAREGALRMGADLAGMETNPEWLWARSWIPSILHGYWLGARQQPFSPSPSEGWYWLSGSPVSQDWMVVDDNPCGASPPGFEDMQQDFLHTCCENYPQGRSWGDLDDLGGWGCDISLRALIEWSADCNNDGIVDKGQILRGQLPDSNFDGVPDGCEVPTCRDADFFRDFNVNGADLGILLSQWGPSTPLTVSDLNRDGAVDGLDLGIFLSFWGPCP